MTEPSPSSRKLTAHPDALPRSDERDYRFARIVATSLMMHLLFIGALLFTPIDPAGFSEDLFRDPNRFVRQLMVIARPKPATFSGPSDRHLSRPTPPPPRERGTFGDPLAVKKAAAPSRSGAPVLDLDKREQDRERLAKTGLLGVLNEAEAAATSNVLAPGGLGEGINRALGGLTEGAGMGDAHGVGGLGSRGLGPGDGGPLGIGRLSGRPRGRGPGGGVALEGSGRERASLDADPTVLRGGLDKSVIARVVRRHQNQIKFCYERELQKDPTLKGKVAVLWIIDGSGAVSSAELRQSTLGNAAVENCILTQVRRWRFPAPRGGGVVQVSYPWIFQTSG